MEHPGFWNHLFDRVRRLAGLIYQRHRVIILEADHDGERPVDLDLQLVIVRQGDFLEGSPLGQIMRDTAGVDGEEIMKRLQRGDRCYTLLENGRCVHYSWVSGTVLYSSEVDYTAPLSAHHSWIYNCYTAPSHRGRGIYARVLGRIVKDCFESGGLRVWIGVLDSNSASIRGIVKAGFKEAAAIERKRWFYCLARTRVTPPHWTPLVQPDTI